MPSLSGCARARPRHAQWWIWATTMPGLAHPLYRCCPACKLRATQPMTKPLTCDCFLGRAEPQILLRGHLHHPDPRCRTSLSSHGWQNGLSGHAYAARILGLHVLVGHDLMLWGCAHPDQPNLQLLGPFAPSASLQLIPAPHKQSSCQQAPEVLKYYQSVDEASCLVRLLCWLCTRSLLHTKTQSAVRHQEL